MVQETRPSNASATTDHKDTSTIHHPEECGLTNEFAFDYFGISSAENTYPANPTETRGTSVSVGQVDPSVMTEGINTELGAQQDNCALPTPVVTQAATDTNPTPRHTIAMLLKVPMLVSSPADGPALQPKPLPMKGEVKASPQLTPKEGSFHAVRQRTLKKIKSMKTLTVAKLLQLSKSSGTKFDFNDSGRSTIANSIYFADEPKTLERLAELKTIRAIKAIYLKDTGPKDGARLTCLLRNSRKIYRDIMVQDCLGNCTRDFLTYEATDWLKSEDVSLEKCCMERCIEKSQVTDVELEKNDWQNNAGCKVRPEMKIPKSQKQYREYTEFLKTIPAVTHVSTRVASNCLFLLCRLRYQGYHTKHYATFDTNVSSDADSPEELGDQVQDFMRTELGVCNMATMNFKSLFKVPTSNTGTVDHFDDGLENIGKVEELNVLENDDMDHSNDIPEDTPVPKADEPTGDGAEAPSNWPDSWLCLFDYRIAKAVNPSRVEHLQVLHTGRGSFNINCTLKSKGDEAGSRTREEFYSDDSADCILAGMEGVDQLHALKIIYNKPNFHLTCVLRNGNSMEKHLDVNKQNRAVVTLENSSIRKSNRTNQAAFEQRRLRDYMATELAQWLKGGLTLSRCTTQKRPDFSSVRRLLLVRSTMRGSLPCLRLLCQSVSSKPKTKIFRCSDAGLDDIEAVGRAYRFVTSDAFWCWLGLSRVGLYSVNDVQWVLVSEIHPGRELRRYMDDLPFLFYSQVHISDKNMPPNVKYNTDNVLDFSTAKSRSPPRHLFEFCDITKENDDRLLTRTITCSSESNQCRTDCGALVSKVHITDDSKCSGCGRLIILGEDLSCDLCGVNLGQSLLELCQECHLLRQGQGLASRSDIPTGATKPLWRIHTHFHCKWKVKFVIFKNRPGRYKMYKWTDNLRFHRLA